MAPRLLLLLPLLSACGQDAILQGGAPGPEGDDPLECQDAADNDRDGLFDCADEGCAAACAEQDPASLTVRISPEAPTRVDDLRCAHDGPPDDTYTLTWLRDGAPVAEGEAEALSTISATQTQRGEAWTCAIRGAAGAEGAATVTIGDAPPTAAVAAVRPAAPYAGQEPLRCLPLDPAVDPDGDALAYAATWTVDGVEFGGGSSTDWPGDTILAAATSGGQVWVCSLVATAAGLEGPPATASATVLPCDADGDGVDTLACGGLDCADDLDTVHPGAVEVCNDGLDNDCDGGAGSCRLTGEKLPVDAAAIRYGEAATDYAGGAAHGGVDLNGDGFDDWIVSSTIHSGRATYGGLAWVLHGPVGGSASLSTAAARIYGGERAFLGGAVLLLPDLSGDGLPDIAVGATNVDGVGEDVGAVYLFEGGLAGDHDSAAALATISGAAVGDGIGSGLAYVADGDGAGTPGLLVGAGAALTGAQLFLGPLAGSRSGASADAAFRGVSESDGAGGRVAADDVDGDGVTDFFVGADGWDDSAYDMGAFAVFYGPALGELSLMDADLLLIGEDDADNAGMGIEAVGDTNSDGLNDVLVGARGASFSARDDMEGVAYLFLGPVVALGMYDADAELAGEDSGDRAAAVLGQAGDVDADGYADMLVGASGNGAVAEYSGAAYLVYGPVTGRVDLASADLRVRGSARMAFAGSAAAGGDQDGDGYRDLLIGMSGDSTVGSLAGAVLFYSGGGL